MIVFCLSVPNVGAQQKAPDTNLPHSGAADRSDAIPYYNLANKYLEKQRFEDAVDNYHEAISRFPYDPDFYVNLGFCYRKLEDFESAEQAFRKALTLNDKDWVTWSNLANALLKQKRYKETVSTFEKCLKLNPPAAEKAAINRDILDIKKVLSMQKQPAPVAGPAAISAVSAASTPAVARKKAPLQAAPVAKYAGPKAPPTVIQASDSEAKKTDSGWDYIYK